VQGARTPVLCCSWFCWSLPAAAPVLRGPGSNGRQSIARQTVPGGQFRRILDARSIRCLNFDGVPTRHSAVPACNGRLMAGGPPAQKIKEGPENAPPWLLSLGFFLEMENERPTKCIEQKAIWKTNLGLNRAHG
jgi:hypothetical protein